MAIRPAYLVSVNEIPLVKVEDFEFKWHPGLSVSQKQKSIDELHSAILKIHPDRKILEVSSKSRIVLGTLLSAFNLTFSTKKYKKTISVETAFQSSKVFTNGGPYYDLLDKTYITGFLSIESSTIAFVIASSVKSICLFVE